jgi:hypothetical protein
MHSQILSHQDTRQHTPSIIKPAAFSQPASHPARQPAYTVTHSASKTQGSQLHSASIHHLSSSQLHSASQPFSQPTCTVKYSAIKTQGSQLHSASIHHLSSSQLHSASQPAIQPAQPPTFSQPGRQTCSQQHKREPVTFSQPHRASYMQPAYLVWHPLWVM